MPLNAEQISFRYTSKSPLILDDLSLTIHQGERIGLVGTSGCGKTTFAKILAGHQHPATGRVLLNGVPLPAKGRSPVQMIFQNPEQAVNPRWKMRKVLEESGQIKDHILESMQIEPDWLDRYPRELSGGELQRFAVARALCHETQYLIADEISTMLDVISQAQIWTTLLKEAENRNLGMIIVTHNRALADKICTKIIEFDTINTQQKG